MKNKKILSLLLALVLVFSLVACSSNDDKPAEKPAGDTETTPKEEGSGETTKAATIAEGTEITVQADGTWIPYYEEAAKRVEEKHPGTKVTIKDIGAFEHLEIIGNTDTLNQDVADVYALPADQFTTYVENDYLAALPAQEMAGRLGGWSDFDAGLGGNLKIDGEYLAFPYNIETLFTFVNTANAEAAGVDHTKPIEVAGAPHEATVLIPMFDAWFGVSPNLAGGIELLAQTDAGFKSTYTGSYQDLDAKQKAAFDEIYNYWKRHQEAGTTLFDAEAGWGYIDKEFATGGNGIARISGPWDAPNFQAQAGEDLEIYPIGHITVAGNPLLHWQGGWTLVANARVEEDANKHALAVALIEEIVNPEYAVDLFKATGKILENVTLDVYTNSDLSDLDKKVIENVLASYEVSEPRPLFKEFGHVWDTWKNAVLSWNNVNPADPAAAYGELQAAFTSMMEQISQ